MFNQDQMGRIADKLGYQGPMHKFNEFLASNPGAQRAYAGLEAKAKMKMNKGGVVRKYANGGFGEVESPIPGGDLYETNPVGGPENMRAPNPGYKFAYDAQGNRYDVPQDYATKKVGQSDVQPLPSPVYNPLQDIMPDKDFYATGTPEYNAQLAQQNAQRAATTQQPIMQTSEGVGAPIVGQAVPQQIPYGPMLDESGQPMQEQVLDTEGNPVLDAEGNIMMRDVMPAITDISAQRMYQPGLPMGGQQLAQGVEFQTPQEIAAGTAQVAGEVTAAQPTVGDTAQATAPFTPNAQQYQAMLASGQVPSTAPAIGSVSAPAVAQTQVPTSTDVAEQQAAQIDQAVRVQAPDARTLSAEELVSAPADATVAAQFAEQVEAAQAQPTEQATVQGQLANLMADFEDGQTPAWAAGAMRNATAIMAQRGLGASSMAGQAIIQAAMESALPIAVQDSQVMAQFEMQNLSNRQARAMLAAQQRAQFIGQEFDQEFQARVTNAARISDIANINFNAEQQIALENARMAQTVDLNNLSNRQAVQMANIAQIANLEMTNLNNRQQAAVQNAQSFLQMDMANLSNTQQTTMFDAQSRVQALLSDQAATNASRQFNATSQNQTDQFFANLQTQVSQYNATQTNAMEQFNVEQTTAIDRFNAEMRNQRDQFNAQNQLVIAQSNAQWRRDIATVNTAAINEANKNNAQAVLDISEQAYANMWQVYEDQMEYAWRTAENELQRVNDLAVVKLQADTSLKLQDLKADAEASSGLGKFIGTVASGYLAHAGGFSLGPG